MKLKIYEEIDGDMHAYIYLQLQDVNGLLLLGSDEP